MQLVLLAAGFGRRFGGLKQLAPVGPNGEAIMDYTVGSAIRAGFDEVVLIVREEVQKELLDHVREHWAPGLRVTPVVQGPVAGTAQAVASAASHITGPFGVANADDLYGDDGFATLANQLRSLGSFGEGGGDPGRLDPAGGDPRRLDPAGGDPRRLDPAGGDPRRLATSGEHVIVAYRLADTIIGNGLVTRGICRVDETGHLTELVEHMVYQGHDGLFLGRPLGAGDDFPGTELIGDEETSMNLWGFDPQIFDHLDTALAGFDQSSIPEVDGKPPELLLPSVVSDLVRDRRATVRVILTKGRCIGITHPDDLPAVRTILAEHGAPPGMTGGS